MTAGPSFGFPPLSSDEVEVIANLDFTLIEIFPRRFTCLFTETDKTEGSMIRPILVTGAAGRVGGVGDAVVAALLRRGSPVRALVRRDDERAEKLRTSKAELIVGDLTQPADVARAMEGCRRMYFGMSVSAPYLEASVIAAAVARERGDRSSGRTICFSHATRATVGNVLVGISHCKIGVAESA